MKKISKTVLSIFMCTVFSALTFFTAKAVLPSEMMAQADTFSQQHRQFAPDRRPSLEGLRKWKLRVVGYLSTIENTPDGENPVPEFLLNLASQITGNPELQSIKVNKCVVKYHPEMGRAGSIVFDFVTILGQISRIII